MTLSERIQSPLSPFFQKLRLAGMILAGVSAAILAAPVSLPLIVTTVAGYLAVAGSVITVISQTTIGEDGEDLAGKSKLSGFVNGKLK